MLNEVDVGAVHVWSLLAQILDNPLHNGSPCLDVMGVVDEPG